MRKYENQTVAGTRVDAQGEKLTKQFLQRYCNSVGEKRIPLHQQHDMAKKTAGFIENVRLIPDADMPDEWRLVADVHVEEGEVEDLLGGFSISGMEELRRRRTRMSTESTYNSVNIITGSERDGWVLGYIGLPWPGPWPKKSGNLFVVDPQGWQAGIAWESNGPEIQKIDGPSESRWGVFQVRFPLPVMSEQDLIHNFHLMLPLLQEQRLKVAREGSR